VREAPRTSASNGARAVGGGRNAQLPNHTPAPHHHQAPSVLNGTISLSSAYHLFPLRTSVSGDLNFNNVVVAPWCPPTADGSRALRCAPGFFFNPASLDSAPLCIRSPTWLLPCAAAHRFRGLLKNLLRPRGVGFDVRICVNSGPLPPGLADALAEAIEEGGLGISNSSSPLCGYLNGTAATLCKVALLLRPGKDAELDDADSNFLNATATRALATVSLNPADLSLSSPSAPLPGAPVPPPAQGTSAVVVGASLGAVALIGLSPAPNPNPPKPP